MMQPCAPGSESSKCKLCAVCRQHAVCTLCPLFLSRAQHHIAWARERGESSQSADHQQADHALVARSVKGIVACLENITTLLELTPHFSKPAMTCIHLPAHMPVQSVGRLQVQGMKVSRQLR